MSYCWQDIRRTAAAAAAAAAAATAASTYSRVAQRMYMEREYILQDWIEYYIDSSVLLGRFETDYN